VVVSSTKVLLFDIDGTLVLTGGAGVRALDRAFHQVTQIADGFRDIPVQGRTDQLIVADALARQQMALEGVWLMSFREVYCRLLEEEIQDTTRVKTLLPGVRDVLDAVASEGRHWIGLLTGNFAASAQIKLEHFDVWHYFRFGAFGDDAIHRNDLVPVALQRAKSAGAPDVAASDVLVIGDTPLDVACAKAHGARAIAVATGGVTAAALHACGADVVFDDLSDTQAFLRLLE
jgi:phosphoglycolate phosphatase-like HAD superfamily hydrolase